MKTFEVKFRTKDAKLASMAVRVLNSLLNSPAGRVVEATDPVMNEIEAPDDFVGDRENYHHTR
jgi:hypothetical protein